MYKIKDKKLLLYGGGSTGKILKKRLEKQSTKVVGFIDKRAEILESVDEIPVYSIEETKSFTPKDNFAIVITTRNVFEHSRIANALYDIGFRNIIFKPYSVLKGCHNAIFEAISKVHDGFMVNFQAYDGLVQECTTKDSFTYRDRGKICESDSMVKAFVPAEFLYSNYLPESIWSACSFLMTHCAVPLYEAFSQGKNEDYEEAVKHYIERFAKPGALQYQINVEGDWEKILVSSREGSYQEMEKMFALDRNFFIEHCPTVCYEGNGRMRLISSGKNRVSFQIARGLHYIPVQMSRDDYNRFINQEALDDLLNYLGKEQLNLFVPIPHPFFYECTYIADNYVQLWPARIGRMLSEMLYQKEKSFVFEQLRVADALDDYGTVARILSMAGCRVERMPNKDFLLEEKVNKLFYGTSVGVFNEEGTYDIALITDRLQRGQIKQILGITRKMCFLCEWNGKDDCTGILDTYGFVHDRVLFESYWGNCKVQGSVYRKAES